MICLIFCGLTGNFCVGLPPYYVANFADDSFDKQESVVGSSQCHIRVYPVHYMHATVHVRRSRMIMPNIRQNVHQLQHNLFIYLLC